MQLLRYDGSWEGFLSAIFYTYEYRLQDVVIRPVWDNQGLLLAEGKEVFSSDQQAQRVFAGIQKWIGKEEIHKLFYIFLSGHAKKEEVLLHLIRQLFQQHKFVLGQIQHPLMHLGNKLVKQVHREKHRMEAFVRFKKLEDGLYFAIIEPDFDVIPVIKHHFEDRYQNQRWVIYDTRRNYGIYYDEHTTEMVILPDNPKDKILSGEGVDNEEHWYENAWSTYFLHVNIKARKNLKLHIQHMPRRYWKFLTEKQPGLSK